MIITRLLSDCDLESPTPSGITRQDWLSAITFFGLYKIRRPIDYREKYLDVVTTIMKGRIITIGELSNIDSLFAFIDITIHSEKYHWNIFDTLNEMKKRDILIPIFSKYIDKPIKNIRFEEPNVEIFERFLLDNGSNEFSTNRHILLIEF